MQANVENDHNSILLTKFGFHKLTTIVDIILEYCHESVTCASGSEIRMLGETSTSAKFDAVSCESSFTYASNELKESYASTSPPESQVCCGGKQDQIQRKMCPIKLYRAPLGMVMKSEDRLWLQQFKEGLLVSCSYDNTIRLWNIHAATFDSLNVRTMRGHSNWVFSIAVLPSHLICSGSFDSTIKIFHPVTTECLETLHGHSGWVSKVIVIDEVTIASASWDHTIRLWDLSGSLQSLRSKVQNANYASSFCEVNQTTSSKSDELFGQPCRSIASMRDSRCFRVLRGHNKQVVDLQWMHSGVLVSAGMDGNIILWDKLGRIIRILNGHIGAIKCISCISNTGIIISAGEDKTIRMWDGVAVGHRTAAFDFKSTKLWRKKVKEMLREGEVSVANLVGIGTEYDRERLKRIQEKNGTDAFKLKGISNSKAYKVTEAVFEFLPALNRFGVVLREVAQVSQQKDKDKHRKKR
jgi:hypothetical protein